MPLIRLTGIPRKFKDSDELNELMANIQADVSRVPVMGIDSDEVMVFAPDDLAEQGLGDEIIAEIGGLFRRPGRTPEVLDNLRDAVARQLAMFAWEYVPQCETVEAVISYMIEPSEVALYVRMPDTAFRPKTLT